MNPTSYSLTPRTLALLASISERLGEVNAAHLHHPADLLRRAHRVSTIHATLALEAAPLDQNSIAQVLDGHAPANPGTAELEVMNTIRLYNLLPGLEPFRGQDLRLAHGELMHGLALDPGQYRTGPMEVLYGHGSGADHIRRRRAPASNLSSQVEQLLHFAENDEAPLVITSCVLHFGLVHLQPFTAGNGRIARLWQRLLLMQQWPVFSFLPVEGFIQRSAQGYYQAIAFAEEREDCGGFITYMMERIDEALHELLMRERQVLSGADRLATFLMSGHSGRFTRKDYRRAFPELSPATASRDLAGGAAAGTIRISGTGRTAWYRPA